MDLNLDLIQQWIIATSLMLPRLLVLFLIFPLLTTLLVPGTVRNGLVLMLALFLSPMAAEMPSPSLGLWIVLVGKEALIGTLLGLGFSIFIWAVQSVGDLIDFQTGTGNAAFFDPVAGHENGVTSEFLTWLVIALFVSAGGLLMLMGSIIESFRLWPVTSFIPDTGAVLQQFVVRQGDTLFEWIVKLAAPVVVVLVLVELGIGLIGRMAPQLNVFVVAQPVKSLLATLMLALFLYFLFDSLVEFMRPGNDVVEFLKAVL